MVVHRPEGRGPLQDGILRREAAMADRRAGKGPYVKDEGGGTQPRSRNANGQWRAKRSDAGKSKGGGKKK